MVFEGAEFLELLLDPTPTFQSQLDKFGQLASAYLTVRVYELHQPRNGFYVQP